LWNATKTPEGAEVEDSLGDARSRLIPFRERTPRVPGSAFVAPTATLIGDVELGEEANVWYGCILRGDVNAIAIGARSNLQDSTVVHVSPGNYPTRVGADVLVGHQALLHGCTLADASYVGIRAVILNGCVVESGAMVAAGALVTEGSRVPSGELWGGAPARRLRRLRDGEAEAMAAAVAHYVEIADEHRRALGWGNGSGSRQKKGAGR
jgi:carbonic anhydrase/acetyltransferase-like protein (isoleucine patch superfamily)